MILEWFPQWLLDLALASEAIIVSANYRLLPEANGLDILTDIEDLWDWTLTSLPNILKQQPDLLITVDLTRILVSGESSGGLLGIILALSHPKDIRAAIACYPCVDMAAFGKPVFKPILGNTFRKDTIERLVASAMNQEATSSDVNQTRLPAMLSCLQHGTLDALYSRGIERADERIRLYPMEVLESGRAVELPSGGISIIQGAQDSVVSPEGSRKFVGMVQNMMGGGGREDGAAVSLSLRDGEHYFDVSTRLEESWLQDTIGRRVEVWLK